jgi:GNAT superfamily N-acetyltransferase
MDVSQLPGPALARRIIEAERDCYVAWIDALRAVPGNPLDASAHALGGATVLLCPRVPGARILNRVLGLTAADRDRIPDFCRMFDEHHVPPCVEVDPFEDHSGPDSLLTALTRAGLAQVGFHQMICGRPDANANANAPRGDDANLRIEVAREKDAAAFAWVHEQVYGDGGLITPLLRHPEFHCFLASAGDRSAALGVLHVSGSVASMANGITVPAFRGRGIQLALLRHRLRVAAEMGCKLIVSQASPRNPSLRNHVRAGLMIAGTAAVWGGPVVPVRKST